MTVVDIFDRCKELNWSPERFREQVEIFLDTQQFDVFTRAHFFNAKRKEVAQIKEKLPDWWDEPIEKYKISDAELLKRQENFKKRLGLIDETN